MEVRQIQQLLQINGQTTSQVRSATLVANRHNSMPQEDYKEFWEKITEERHRRIELDHLVRQMELELLDIKNQVQSCKTRFEVQNQSKPRDCGAYRPNITCLFDQPSSSLRCCSCAKDPLPYCCNRGPRNSTTLWSLV